MMAQLIRLGMRQELNQELVLQHPSAASASIFPTLEKWLEYDDRMKGVLHVARNKRMSRYRSVIDFLLSETIPMYRPACKKFYKGKGPPLRDMLSRSVLVMVEAGLLQMVEFCYAIYIERRNVSWTMAVAAADHLDSYNETHPKFSLKEFLEWAIPAVDLAAIGFWAEAEG